MRHTIKMVMIPEELYRSLMLAGNSTKQNQIDGPENATALSSSQSQMQQELLKQRQQTVDGTKGMAESGGADEQQIRFTTAYKRYRKLLQEDRERPQPVNVRNLPELEETVKNVMKKRTTHFRIIQQLNVIFR